jgi:FkbM family methyltransferase
MLAKLRAARGILRSLRIYHGNRGHRDAMDRLYSHFVKQGDLVFDVGAHVGDRIGSFRRLGARVVALEPQPGLVRVLRWMYGRDRNVTILKAAIGRTEGTVTLNLNPDNPTIATASRQFIEAAKDAAGWEGQRWSGSVEVPGVTLDALIARHGEPSFIKIDVEGFEAEALAGLSRQVATLSFEFTTIQRDVAQGCIRRCAELGYRRFEAALGESQTFVHDRWISANEIGRWLAELPQSANSGDIYAQRNA